MADLTSADVTVTQPIQAVFYPPIPITIAFAYVSFGNGVLNYPAGGVPMPAGLFGMRKAIGYVAPTWSGGYRGEYDIALNTIHIYQCAGAGAPMVELGHVAVPAMDFTLFIVGE